jgi:hypothetical protein
METLSVKLKFYIIRNNCSYQVLNCFTVNFASKIFNVTIGQLNTRLSAGMNNYVLILAKMLKLLP